MATTDHEMTPANILLVDDRDENLMVMNVQMPGMDGYEAARQIKMLPNGHDIPIIMVSAIYTEDPHILKGHRPQKPALSLAPPITIAAARPLWRRARFKSFMGLLGLNN